MSLKQNIRDKSVRYWMVSALVLVATIWAKPLIDERLNLADVRNTLFGILSTSATNPSRPRHVKLVLIKDDEFWGGDLHHRWPTDRRYLARLIRALDAAEASVIALDFDLRLPDGRVSARVGDYAAVDAFQPYRDETDELVRAIGDVARRRPVILSKAMTGPVDGPFELIADAWQPYGICTAMRGDGRWDNPGTPAFPLDPVARGRISCGYIALMSDKRRVPPPAIIRGRPYRLDSFPLAIVRARDEAAATPFRDGEYYASYVPAKTLDNPRVVVSAHDLLSGSATARAVLQGWPVIIGAAWHDRARGAGNQVDVHDTPIGRVSGAIIHENLAEAVLSDRTYPSLSDAGVLALEVGLGALAMLLFGLAPSWWGAAAMLAAMMGAVLAMQWLSLQLFGMFIDLFAPVVGLGVHAIADRILSVHK